MTEFFLLQHRPIHRFRHANTVPIHPLSITNHHLRNTAIKTRPLTFLPLESLSTYVREFRIATFRVRIHQHAAANLRYFQLVPRIGHHFDLEIIHPHRQRVRIIFRRSKHQFVLLFRPRFFHQTKIPTHFTSLVKFTNTSDWRILRSIGSTYDTTQRKPHPGIV